MKIKNLSPFLAASVLMSGSAYADINWDGDNGVGNFSYNNNWYGDTQPTWAFASGNLVFNYNNGSASSLYYDYGAYRNINDIIFETTFTGPTTWNGDGTGINFNQRLENRSSSTITIGSMNLSAAKNGAGKIELNPVNGDLVLNGNIYNDNNKGYSVYGANGKTLTVNTILGGTTAAFTIEQNSIVNFTASQAITGKTTIKDGRLEISATGGVAGAIDLGLNSGTANAELRLTDSDGGFDENANITVVSGSSGTKTISSTNTTGVNTLSGSVTLSNPLTITQTAGGTLNLSGVLASTSAGFTLTAGTLRLSGAGANTGTQTTTINSGATVEIDKTNVAAFASSQVVLVSGTVKWLQAGVAGNDVRYTVNAGGVLDLNGYNADFAYSGGGTDQITLSGGTVQTGAGTWKMQGNNAIGATVNGTTVSTITGNVDLGAADRTTNISDNASGLDLNWSANITDASSGVTTRKLTFNAASGTPEVSLGGNNDYRGTTTIGAGVTLYADNANALGSTVASTTVISGGTLALRGGLTYAAEAVTIDYNTTPGLRSVSGDNVWTGTITNPGGGNTIAGTIQVDAGSLTVQGSLGAFSSTTRQLGKTGDGALIYDNAATNIAGNLFVNGGVFAFLPSGEVNTRAANVAVNGGTIASPDNITLSLGASGGSNTIRFGANGGGFAAYGADINVDLAGVSTLVWGGSTVSQVPILKNVSGAATILNNIYFGGTGYTGSETVTISGGGGSGATGAITVSGGVITGFSLTTVGSGYNSAPTVTIGAPTSDGGTTNFLANNAPLILNSTISQNKVTMLDNIDLAASGATFTGQREIQVLDNASSTADRAVIDSVISSSKSGVGINKTGTGVLEFANGQIMTYDGDTTVSAGTLLVNGSISGTGNVAVNSGATLGGSGTIGGATTINSGGIHAPGNSPDVEKFTSDLAYADGSIFAWDIDRTKAETRGTGYDGVNVTGTLTGLDGADAGSTFDAKFRIIIGDADFSNSFWAANNHSWTDIFTGADGSTPKSWTSIFGGGFEYYNTSGSSIDAPTTGSFTFAGGNTLNWNFSAVPEPTSALAGLLIAAGLLRRRRSA